MIKPTMSHAVNKEQLNELLVKYYEHREKQLEECLVAVRNVLDDSHVDCLGSASDGQIDWPISCELIDSITKVLNQK